MSQNEQNLYLKDKAEFEKRQRQAEALKNKEYRKNHPVEDTLKQRIIGQLGPIYTLSGAIRRKQNGWHDEDRPLVFMFCGPSGVGKTELAKGKNIYSYIYQFFFNVSQVLTYLYIYIALAEYSHDDLNKGFVRIDMTEYQHAHEISKFIGSPPGYHVSLSLL